MEDRSLEPMEDRLIQALPDIEQPRQKLATASFKDPNEVSAEHRFEDGHFWLGRSLDGERIPIGFRDDRHVLMVAGTRDGKGTSYIVNNLCLWPGSALVIDTKGENAEVTAARRGEGSDYCEGMGQKVYNLDPYGVVENENIKRSSLNPLDFIDPESDSFVDDAGLVSKWMLVEQEGREGGDFWNNSCAAYLKAITMHVVTSKEIPNDKRNLNTVRDLAIHGDTDMRMAASVAVENLIEEAETEEERERAENIDIKSPHEFLFQQMVENDAVDGLVRKAGFRYFEMYKVPKQFLGMVETAATHTEFLESAVMKKTLEKSDFDFLDMKTDPDGITVYLNIPSEFIETHARWLRMMVNLAIKRMKSSRKQPASGHPVLFLLDEFAALKRMRPIENAFAELAGFGVKLWTIVQHLGQLKEHYKDNWQNFISGAGVQIYFGLRDHFSLEYLSKHLGETEVVRSARNVSFAEGRTTGSSKTEQESETKGETSGTSTTTGQSVTDGVSLGRSDTEGTSRSAGRGGGRTDNYGKGKSRQVSRGSGSSSNASQGSGSSWGMSGLSSSSQSSSNSSSGQSVQSNSGVSDGWSTNSGRSDSRNWNETKGRSSSRAESHGETHSKTSNESSTVSGSRSISQTLGYSTATSSGESETKTAGLTEHFFKTRLCPPDEMEYELARIDDAGNENHPGVALVKVAGREFPFHVQRCQYFDDEYFTGLYDPHWDHEPPRELMQKSEVRYLEEFEDEGGDLNELLLEEKNGQREAYVSEWEKEAGDQVKRGEVICRLEGIRDPEGKLGSSVGVLSTVTGVLVERSKDVGEAVRSIYEPAGTVEYSRRTNQLVDRSKAVKWPMHERMLQIKEYQEKAKSEAKIERKRAAEEKDRRRVIEAKLQKYKYFLEVEFLKKNVRFKGLLSVFTILVSLLVLFVSEENRSRGGVKVGTMFFIWGVIWFVSTISKALKIRKSKAWRERGDYHGDLEDCEYVDLSEVRDSVKKKIENASS